jgi:hypothetical protein
MNVDISTTMHKPVPSTSGVQNTNHSPRQVLSEDSEIESDVNDEELCCVCKKISPSKLKDLPFLKIVNWAQCDRCTLYCVQMAL